MRLSRCVATLVCAGAGLVLPAAADAEPTVLPGSIFAVPLQQNPDPEKPMCIGVQTATWGDGKGNYTGACRYGAPLGPMQAAIQEMDRKKAIGNAKENGLKDNLGDKLQVELNTIARLPMVTGHKRLKRYAQLETRAAEDDKGSSSPKPSWLRRAAVNCAIFGAIGAETTLLWEVIVNKKLPPKEMAKNATLACAASLITPGVNRWIKKRGYDMEA